MAVPSYLRSLPGFPLAVFLLSLLVLFFMSCCCFGEFWGGQLVLVPLCIWPSLSTGRQQCTPRCYTAWASFLLEISSSRHISLKPTCEPTDSSDLNRSHYNSFWSCHRIQSGTNRWWAQTPVLIPSSLTSLGFLSSLVPDWQSFSMYAVNGHTCFIFKMPSLSLLALSDFFVVVLPD